MSDGLMKAVEEALEKLQSLSEQVEDTKTNLRRALVLARGPQGSKTCAACGHITKGPQESLDEWYAECESCHTLFSSPVDKARLEAPVVSVADMYGVKVPE